MARIAGVNIPDNKHTVISLTYIYGVGRTTAQSICAATGVNPAAKIKDLSDLAARTEFGVFKSALEKGKDRPRFNSKRGVVKALRVPGGADKLTRKEGDAALAETGGGSTGEVHNARRF